MTVLIDTGPSPHGFHAIENFLTCPMKFWYALQDAKDGIVAIGDRFALNRGSIGHTGLAHHYARQVAVRRGFDAEKFYPPVEAMRMVASKLGEDDTRLAFTQAHRAFDFYTRSWAMEDLDVIGIEKILSMEVEDEWSGIHYPYTARADLIVREGGKVFIYDHKFVGRIEDKTFKRYALSGQFLGLWHLGKRTYGADFGGVRINVVGCQVLGVERRDWEVAPYALKRYPQDVARARREMAALAERAKEPATKFNNPRDEFPMALSEYACFTPYGQCKYHERCRWGATENFDGLLKLT